MGWFSENGKEGTFIEGRASSHHQHNDGSYGRDIYAARVSYSGGEKVSESRDDNWGKMHESGGSDSGK